MELSIIFLPLIASIISGFFGRYIGDRNSEIATSALVSISALLSIYVLYQVIVNQYEENIVIATWISSGSLDVNWSMLIDPCLLYTSPSPRDRQKSRMPSSA